jgi:hypothetical protein
MSAQDGLVCGWAPGQAGRTWKRAEPGSHAAADRADREQRDEADQRSAERAGGLGDRARMRRSCALRGGTRREPRRD